MEKLFAILFGVGGVGIISYFFRDKISAVSQGAILTVSQISETIASTGTYAFLASGGDSLREKIIEEAWQGLRAELEEKEGYRNVVYKDTRGLPTVGIGHLVVPADNLKVGDTISDARVEAFYKADAEKAFKAAISQADELGRFTPEFIIALTSVNFQLGTGWKYKFKNTYAKLKNNDWRGAISNLKKSLWYQQTPNRVLAFANAIEDAYTQTA